MVNTFGNLATQDLCSLGTHSANQSDRRMFLHYDNVYAWIRKFKATMYMYLQESEKAWYGYYSQNSKRQSNNVHTEGINANLHLEIVLRAKAKQCSGGNAPCPPKWSPGIYMYVYLQLYQLGTNIITAVSCTCWMDMLGKRQVDH